MIKIDIKEKDTGQRYVEIKYGSEDEYYSIIAVAMLIKKQWKRYYPNLEIANENAESCIVYLRIDGTSNASAVAMAVHAALWGADMQVELADPPF